ncbi:glycosyltransferase [Paucibacter sp. B2R-40]|uniref:tetratricopeptide repeat-containing glycosyltransferase n=1 Tax=Paucibacter sp. B2R-40 TaxID=2893554 RepID=UPI0021E4F2F3|nr:glycosyltransferase [Paucibacter sp. B2R-40]MCV2355006.1 glycosyltransferase [Paucibacter sp. B2R-40]
MASPALAMRTCLVVIARDEAACIERLLNSARPWVDEMLVLDTGSVDATPTLAVACGARLEKFLWCDDFAAARNAALDAAGADWHVLLDADEWLISGGEALAALRQTPANFVGTIALQDQFLDGALRHAQSRLSRVLPGNIRYAGRVHEQPHHSLPIQPLNISVGHDGYLPDRLLAKRGRNQRLLLQELQVQPERAYLWYQLGKDCAVYDEHARAEQYFEKAAALPHPEQGWWFDLVTRRLFALKQLKAHEAAIQFAQTQLGICAASPDFFFALGDLLLDFAADTPEQAPHLLPMIEDAWRRCLELGERPDLSGAVAGRGSYLAAHNLALVLDGTGRAQEAADLRRAFAG